MRCWADVEKSCEVDGRVWGVGGSSGGGGMGARERCGVEGNTCVQDELTMMKMLTRVRADERFLLLLTFLPIARINSLRLFLAPKKSSNSPGALYAKCAFDPRVYVYTCCRSSIARCMAAVRSFSGEPSLLAGGLFFCLLGSCGSRFGALFWRPFCWRLFPLITADHCLITG
jgi:hypothetical protein